MERSRESAYWPTQNERTRMDMHELLGDGCRLLPHQLEAVEWLRNHPKALLADDVGLGKTIEVAAYLCSLVTEKKFILGHERILWITSASLIGQTAAELGRFVPALLVLTQNDPLFKSQKTSKARDTYGALFPTGPDILMVSHEYAARNGDVLFARFGTASVVVIDETMKLKGEGTNPMRVRDLIARIPRIVAMTATPYENDPTETFRVLQLPNPPGLWSKRAFDEQFVEWQEAYTIPSTGQYVPAKATGFLPGRLEEFRSFLNGVMLRRTADEVGLRLPIRTGETVRWVPLNPAQRAAFDAIQGKGGIAHLKRNQSGRHAGGSSALVDAFMDVLRADFSDEQVIVCCESLAVLPLVEEQLRGAGIGFVSVEGATPKKDRDQALMRFREDPDVLVFLGSKVLELGLNLQHVRVLVSLDSSYNPQREAQREGRIRRIGSPHDTYVHLTLMPDTPTARAKWDALARKRQEAFSLLGA